MTKTAFTPKRLAISGLLVGISVLGSYISVPMPGLGSTIAFDSLPGFFGAVFLTPGLGGLIGAIGHLMTAVLHGFPQGIPSHMLVMVCMGIACASFGALYHKNRVLAVVVGYLINGPITLFLASWVVYVMGVTPTLINVFTINFYLVSLCILYIASKG